LGQVFLQFRKFPVKTFELAFGGELKGMEKARFWVPLFALAGLFAFPGATFIFSMAKKMFGVDVEKEGKRALMEWAGNDPDKRAVAKWVMYGVGSSAGVDLSRRVGMGDFIPDDLLDLAGPSVSTIVRTIQLSARGEWLEVIRNIVPAAGNFAGVVANGGEVYNPWNRGRKTIELTPAEQAMKLVGFTPVRQSVERDVAGIISYSEQQRRLAETRAIDGVIRALMAYANNQSQSNKESVQVATERAEALGITPNRVMSEITRKQQTAIERALQSLPKKQVPNTLDLIKFALP
jgi:hypothetical protein